MLVAPPPMLLLLLLLLLWGRAVVRILEARHEHGVTTHDGGAAAERNFRHRTLGVSG